MGYEIDTEISQFRSMRVKLGSRYVVKDLAQDAFSVGPKGFGGFSRSDKSLGICLMALTHGNEFVGVRVLNELLEMLDRGVFELKVPVGFILGNPQAAMQGKRFLGSDLNRSFDRDTLETKEHQRARDLEAPLADTCYLLDIHQTREKTDEPFFIFPFAKNGFNFARQISPSTPIVTHWGRPFSKTGRCTDEYTNTKDGIGITVEIGQNGFGAYKIAAGFKYCLNAIETAAVNLLEGGSLPMSSDPVVYTWERIIEFPEAAEAHLVEGMYNFKDLVAGEIIGTVDGVDIVAPEHAKIIFPFYPKGSSVRPAELCRLMKRVSLADLPGEV